MSEDYPAYPIYDVKFKWPQEGEGCPDGTNGTSMILMLREKNISEVVQKSFNIVEELSEQHNVHPSEIDVKITFKRMEEWCLHWFNHWTFDCGLSDAEILKSFRDYVWRMGRLNRELQKYLIQEDGSRFYYDEICLMGAEDEWRWKGADDTPAPCRCKHCKEQGVVRINH